MRVCEWMDWRDALGKACTVSARVALSELERRGMLVLPEARRITNFENVGEAKQEAEPLAVAQLESRLADIGPIEIVGVFGDRQLSRTWTRLMEQEHYLGQCKLRGAQMRYLVRSAEHGLLGGLSFSAATRRLQCRDEWIGWRESAWRANLQRVICNSRLVIVGSAKVPNLASRILGLVLRRVGQDWQDHYGYEPVLVETFVDREKYNAASYRAANWQRLGETAGREDGFANGKVSTGKKDVYVYRLRRDAREILCREPEDRLTLREQSAEPGADWVEHELASARIFDGRLRRRMYQVGRNFAAQSRELVPQTSNGSMAEVKATYRFFKNDRVTMEGLLKGHAEQSIARARQHAVVLAVQDTTSLNYTAHSPEGAGLISTKQRGNVGMLLHATVAFTPAGTPLGVLDAQCWARDPEQFGKRAKRHQLPIEEKESIKWLRSYRVAAEAQRLCPNTVFVSVGDRESDIFELFDEAAHCRNGPQLLIRADRGRQRQTIEQSRVDSATPEYEYLWQRLNHEAVAGCRFVHVPQKPGRAARTAKIEIRYASLVLKPPTNSKLQPVAVWAVYAREIHYPRDLEKPIEWMLLTTVEVSSFNDALERICWYTVRWGIELFHRILKSGCRIEDRRLSDLASLRKCLAFDLMIAWRTHALMKASRDTPDAPCDDLLQEDEWKIVYAVALDQPPPATAPPIRTAVRLIAKLGGFLGRNRDGEPGMITIWRGITRVHSMVLGAKAALRHMANPP
jgi:hypothetical protein